VNFRGRHKKICAHPRKATQRAVNAEFAGALRKNFRTGALGVEVSHSLDAILPRVDVFNLLRIQFERQVVRPFPSTREYAHLYAMDGHRLKRAKENVLILAPGPINRGLEVTPDVADGPQSAILRQVSNGVAVRMAALWMCLGNQ